MTRSRSVESFRIQIPPGFAHRLLGFHRGNRPPRASVAAMFEEEMAVAHELIESRAAWRHSDAGLPGSVHIDPELPLVAVVCTIGPMLEARVATLADEGHTARAMVLDAIGSSAAEEVADRSNQVLCGQASGAGRATGRRRSPGYGRWDVSEQRALLGYVEPDDIGVTLNERCMMVPRKSVSYVVPLLAAATAAATAAGTAAARGAAAAGGTATTGAPATADAPPVTSSTSGRHDRASSDDRCSRCNLVDCPYRDDEHANQLAASASPHREARQ